MSTNLTQRLTDILTANPKMAHLIADKIGTKYRLPELVLYDELKDYSTFAQYLLDQLPDSYFSSALARVADVLSEHGQCFVQLESACDDKWKAAIVRWQDDFSLYFLEEPLPFSQALRALWLVLLARACEKCEECRGEGRVTQTYGSIAGPTDDCYYCHGTGKKMGKMGERIIAALVGKS